MTKTKKTKEVIFVIAALVLIAVIIYLINFTGNDNPPMNNSTDQIYNHTINCIAQRTKLVVSPTCGYCTKQKELLGDHLDKFDVYYTNQNPEIVRKYQITGVPSWIIDERVISGYKTIEQLKNLTGC